MTTIHANGVTYHMPAVIRTEPHERIVVYRHPGFTAPDGVTRYRACANVYLDGQFAATIDLPEPDDDGAGLRVRLHDRSVYSLDPAERSPYRDVTGTVPARIANDPEAVVAWLVGTLTNDAAELGAVA